MTLKKPCQIPGCSTSAEHFIGSLTAEIEGKDKWLYVCNLHEKQIARENALIAERAVVSGMTIAAYIEKRRKGGTTNVQARANGDRGGV